MCETPFLLCFRADKEFFRKYGKWICQHENFVSIQNIWEPGKNIDRAHLLNKYGVYGNSEVDKYFGNYPKCFHFAETRFLCPMCKILFTWICMRWQVGYIITPPYNPSFLAFMLCKKSINSIENCVNWNKDMISRKKYEIYIQV